MKRIKLYMIMFAAMTAGFALTSCNDDFMNEVPQTAITVPGYFNSVGDLETYANGLYSIIAKGPMVDANSDNATGPGHTTAMETWDVVNGLLSKSTAGGWGSWGNVRSANVLIDNADRVQGNEADIKHWIGFARYIRALLYIDMVQRYSDVPWIEHAVTSSDPDVYRASDPRTFVVDKIMEDLEYACTNLKSDIGNRTRVHKYCALTLLSRFALYEGTYRKYHSELGLQTKADEYGHTVTTLLERAVSASQEIMNRSDLFDIAARSVDEPSAGIKGSPAYRALYSSLDLGSNKEIIRWIAYNQSVASGYTRDAIRSSSFGLSRSLMESYLTFDGRPFSTVANYATLPYYDGFAGRDPRLAEAFAHPGSTTQKSEYVRYPIDPVRGGYNQEKFEANQSIRANLYDGLPFYRYAEVLLNFAEAKAELGQFSTPDANNSINKLRNRVGMPAFDADREVDQTLRSQYPNVTDPAILAVRRERRVELACEGLRLQDIYRWGVGERFLDPASQQGIWIPALGKYDVSGDGIPDYAIYQKQSDIPSDWTSLIKCYYLELNPSPDLKIGDPAETFVLSEGTRGYIIYRDQAPRGFISPKDYYRPVPVTQTILNPNLVQPFGWKD